MFIVNALDMAKAITANQVIMIPPYFIDLTGNITRAAILSKIVHLLDSNKSKNAVYHSYQDFADYLHTSKFTIKDNIKKLEEKGLIETLQAKTPNGIKKLHYRLTPAFKRQLRKKYNEIEIESDTESEEIEIEIESETESEIKEIETESEIKSDTESDEIVIDIKPDTESEIKNKPSCFGSSSYFDDDCIDCNFFDECREEIRGDCIGITKAA